MARPVKKRRVCRMPRNKSFGPLEDLDSSYEEVLSIDEYETIRLIDLEGLTQEECSEQMGVARTTVQSIYRDARKKLAASLVNGHRLRIAGGNYTLCNGNGRRCGLRSCKTNRGDVL